jgi:hypothetical protein
MRRVGTGWAVVGLVLASGCVSLSSMQTADTLGRGRVQVGLEPGVAGVVDPSSKLTAAPAADLSVRYGLFEHFDIGGRFGQSGLELQTRLMVTPRAWPVVVSLAPSIAGTFRVASNLAITGQLLNISLPLLVGVRFGAGHQLVFGPRLHVLGVVPADPGETGRRVWAAGGSLGLAFRISEAVVVMPELAVVAPLTERALIEAQDSFSQLTGGLLVQARVGFLLGRTAPTP